VELLLRPRGILDLGVALREGGGERVDLALK
jgi:hypothetical protein